jgi:CRISPR-associated endonuclease Csn1
VSCDRATGRIKIQSHDCDKTKGEEGFYRIGVQSAKLTKYHVDVLGKTLKPCRKEKRNTFNIDMLSTTEKHDELA